MTFYTGEIPQLGEDTRDSVTQHVDISFTAANEMTQRALSVLPGLVTAAEIAAATDIINAGLGDIVFNHIPNVFPLDIPALPTRPTYDEIIIDPSLYNLDVPWVDTEQEYQSALLNAIVAQLLSDVVNGGTGLTPAVQAADQELNTLRIERETQKLLDNATSVYEAMGWRLPPGELIGLRQEAINQAAIINTESSDRILHETFNLALTNKWKAIEDGIAATKEQMSFRIESAKLGILQFQARIERIKAIIQLHLGVAQIQTLKNENLTKLYTADIQARDTVLQGVVKAFDVMVRQSEAEANTLIQEKKIEFEGAVQLYGVYKEMLKSIALVLAQLSASWIGVTHFGESISYQEQKSESINVHESESHQFQWSWNVNENYNYSE